MSMSLILLLSIIIICLVLLSLYLYKEAFVLDKIEVRDPLKDVVVYDTPAMPNHNKLIIYKLWGYLEYDPTTKNLSLISFQDQVIGLIDAIKNDSVKYIFINNALFKIKGYYENLKLLQCYPTRICSNNEISDAFCKLDLEHIETYLGKKLDTDIVDEYKEIHLLAIHE